MSRNQSLRFLTAKNHAPYRIDGDEFSFQTMYAQIFGTSSHRAARARCAKDKLHVTIEGRNYLAGRLAVSVRVIWIRILIGPETIRHRVVEKLYTVNSCLQKFSRPWMRGGD